MAIPTQFSTGAFLPTTTLFDVSQVYSTDVNSPEFKELIVRLYQSVGNMAQVVNVSIKGMYVQNEFVTGELMFPNPNNNSSTATAASMRQVWGKMINCGALPASGTKKIPHNIPVQPGFTFVQIWGCATFPSTLNTPKTGNYIPLPYASATTLTEQLELQADNTNIYITTGGYDYSTYTTTYVMLKYIKS